MVKTEGLMDRSDLRGWAPKGAEQGLLARDYNLSQSSRRPTGGVGASWRGRTRAGTATRGRIQQHCHPILSSHPSGRKAGLRALLDVDPPPAPTRRAGSSICGRQDSERVGRNAPPTTHRFAAQHDTLVLGRRESRYRSRMSHPVSPRRVSVKAYRSLPRWRATFVNAWSLTTAHTKMQTTLRCSVRFAMRGVSNVTRLSRRLGRTNTNVAGMLDWRNVCSMQGNDFCPLGLTAFSLLRTATLSPHALCPSVPNAMLGPRVGYSSETVELPRARAKPLNGGWASGS